LFFWGRRDESGGGRAATPGSPGARPAGGTSVWSEYPAHPQRLSRGNQGAKSERRRPVPGRTASSGPTLWALVAREGSDTDYAARETR